jgi:single-strand DNA-binding protein
MSHVEVRQIGHVAATPVVETLSVNGRTQNKALVTVISNTHWKDSEGKVSERATAITWTLWGKVAVNASSYLDVGSKVAVVGRLEGNRYTGKDGKEVFGFYFTARSVEYLESKTDTEARRNRRANLASEHEPKLARSAGRKTSRSPASAKEA